MGFYEYGLSPHHLKPFKGVINPGMKKFFMRTIRQAIFIVPPVAITLMVKNKADKLNELEHRKGLGGH